MAHNLSTLSIGNNCQTSFLVLFIRKLCISLWSCCVLYLKTSLSYDILRVHVWFVVFKTLCTYVGFNPIFTSEVLPVRRRVPLVQQSLLSFPERMCLLPFLVDFIFLHLSFSVYFFAEFVCLFSPISFHLCIVCPFLLTVSG
jgi:hypothetical protein